jgi:RNA polymerase sigma-70 factor (ECF subfamily)
MQDARPVVTSPDLLLARRAARSDARAWDEIVDRFGGRIYNLALRFAGNRPEAEDLTQEIFLKLYRQLHRYPGDVPLLAWAMRLSRNLCIDHYRHHRTRKGAEVASEEVLRQLPGGEDPRERNQAAEQRRLVHRTLAEMPDSQATVVMLRDLQGLSYDEIAAFYEVPVGTIKSRLNRARRELVRRLEEHLGLGRAAAGGAIVMERASSC